jgi:transcriptional regulator with PAS, ATPase and Fis domain
LVAQLKAKRAGTIDLTGEFYRNSVAIHERAIRSLFDQLDTFCEGAIAVDREARVVWINEKYAETLGLKCPDDALGRDVEDVIPNSLMRQVAETGRAILLDIMEFGNRAFVVTRVPIKDDENQVIGAIGFVLYDRLQHLRPIVDKFAHLQAELAKARRSLAEHRRPRYSLANYVGTGPAISEVKRLARRAAELDATVLILGETGTGKELVAQAIHGISARARQPFVAVNVAAIPEALLESELFGAVPGAFTGATDRKERDGKLKVADGGSLFLDEIGDMPLPLQAKLLRVLQEREFEPLGSNKVVHVDVRIVAATNIDLQERVAKGLFRSDLYHRLNVLTIKLPSLRDTLSDLPAIADTILEQISARTGHALRSLDPGGLGLLCAHRWPGNIRELSNVLERAMMLTDSPRLRAEDFAPILSLPAEAAPASLAGLGVRRLRDAMNEFERSALQAALAVSHGRAAAAAQALGISRATFYKKAAKLGLKFEAGS